MKLNEHIIIIFFLVFCIQQAQASSIADLIPDNTATHTAIKSGSWFSADTWSTNTIPSSAAIVVIPSDYKVTYAESSNDHIFAIKVHGTFIMSQPNSASITKLVVDTFTGTMNSKIHIYASGVTDGKIDIVFKPFDIKEHKNAALRIYPFEWNTAAKAYFFDGLDHHKVTYKITTTGGVDRFDTATEGNANTVLTEHSSSVIYDGPGVYGRSSWDAGQLSLGLTTMGQIQVLGKEKTTKVKLSTDAAKNQKTLNLSISPVGWGVGDELVITSGGNLLTSSKGVDQNTIATISGSTIKTTSNLLKNHEGRAAEDLHCYVGNLTRNITFSSADISEISRRGHVMAMHNPIDVQFRFAQFKNLGRTDKSRVADDFIFDKWLDPVVFTSKISSLGQEVMQLKKPDANKITNSRGRYSIHLHRTGAVNGTKAAYVQGNVVWGNPGWGITHHDSHAEISNNIVYDVSGAGIVSEAGNETGFWDDNLVVDIRKARNGTGDAYTPVNGENYFDPNFYHSALFYDDYLFRGEGLAMRGRAVVCRNNVISDVIFGVGITNINPVKTNLLRVDPEALAVIRPKHQVNHFPLAVNGYSSEGDGVLPVEVALFFENTTVINSFTALNSIERDMAVNHESRSVLDGFKSWGCNTGFQLTYQADYSFKDVYISGKNSNSRGIDMWKHSSNHSFENIKIEDCGTAIRVSKVVGLGTDYLKLKTRNNGFTQWTFVNYSENNVTDHYALDLDTEFATYDYKEHPDNIVYLTSEDKIDREISFTITESTSDLEVDVATEDFKFTVDGYISDSAGSYNYGIKSAPAQGNLRFDYPERIYEFASKLKFEEYLEDNAVFKDATNGDQLYFIIKESVPDRLSFEYKTFSVRINILNAPNTAPYINAVYEDEINLLPQLELISLKGIATQSKTSTEEFFETTPTETIPIETPASRAIDGNTNGRIHAQLYQRGLVPVGSSSYTESELEPHWDLDLGKNFDIESIEVWGSQTLNGVAKPGVSETSKNYFVMIDDEPFGDGNMATEKLNAIAYYHSGNSGSRLFSKTGIGKKARYIRIQGEGDRKLSLAEVSVLGREEGNRYCNLLEEGGILVNGDFECGYNSDWEFAVSGSAAATFFDGETESYGDAVSARVTVSTGQGYNKVVLKNKEYNGNLNNKTLRVSSYAKSPDTGTSFKYQIFIKNSLGVTTNKTSSAMNLTDVYQEFNYEIDVTEDTQVVQLKINLGSAVGTYYFDTISSSVEDSLYVDDIDNNDNFVLYPNPVSDILYMKNYKDLISGELYTTAGRLIQVFDVQTGELNVSDIERGIYILVVRKNDGLRISRKILIYR
tara:strand:- start:14666 stop:18628 length:3963 start_codon:yes stop_codon:yes gene_type:complete